MKCARLLLLWFAIPIVSAAQPGDASQRPEIVVEHFKPAQIRIHAKDLPAPFATESADNPPRTVPPPERPVLRTPPNFSVSVFAEVPHARWLVKTPTGDVLCAASRDNEIYLLCDADGDGWAEHQKVLLDRDAGLNQPFGMAFTDDQLFVGNTDAVVAFPFEEKEGVFTFGSFKQIVALPGEGYRQHWTRNVVLSPDGTKLYTTVGSETNVTPEKPPRACVIRTNLAGSQYEVFASGLRKPCRAGFPSDHRRTLRERERT